MRILTGFLCIIGLLSVVGCGKPAVDVVFNTSTEAYPVSTDEDAAALASIGGAESGIAVSSTVRIQMQGVGEAAMEAMHLEALILNAKEGDLRFVQLAKCYVMPRSQTSPPVLVGTARESDLSEDGRSLKFHADSGPELSGILKSPFTILIEIEGNPPTGKVAVSAELKMKATVRL